MKKALVLLLMLLPALLFADEITFSADSSQVRLRNGMESVILSGNASVRTGSLEIRADDITISGEDWRYIECSGNVIVEDNERGITIETSTMWYDRLDERLLIASYFEIEDRSNEMSARANHLEYAMSAEILILRSMVRFSKINDDDVITGSSEQLTYERDNEVLTLRGSCSVVYDGNTYSAEQVSIDINTDSITLSSAIRGTING